MKKNHESIDSFTLIELLVVILVISMLASISFKMFAVATRTANVAKTNQILQRLAMAIEEFKSEYGQYPPCSSTSYVHENPDNQTDWLDQHYFANNQSHNWIMPKNGLCSYLWPRESGGRHDNEDRYPDNERDREAKERWKKFIDGLQSGGSTGARDVYMDPETGLSGMSQPGAEEMGLTNAQLTVHDAWGGTIHYSSKQPYQTYELWSSGGDGSGNIYYNKGF